MKRLQQLLPPVVAAVIGFGSWELLLRLTQPDGFVLPAPSKIAEAVLENSEAIQTGTRVTGFIVVSGLLAGVFFGIAAALLVTAFRTANETLTPLAVAVNAIPIVALAPIFNAWFGLLSPRSNQAVVVALVFFPIFINTSRGLVEVEPSQIELMESYGAQQVADHTRGAYPQRHAVLFHGAEVGHFFGCHRGDRCRVLRWASGRSR